MKSPIDEVIVDLTNFLAGLTDTERQQLRDNGTIGRILDEVAQKIRDLQATEGEK